VDVATGISTAALVGSALGGWFAFRNKQKEIAEHGDTSLRNDQRQFYLLIAAERDRVTRERDELEDEVDQCRRELAELKQEVMPKLRAELASARAEVARARDEIVELRATSAETRRRRHDLDDDV
jgi:septal ring factor EnvC (AmiA/AmiB activator)